MSSKNNYPRDYPGWLEEQHRSEKVVDTSNALYAVPRQVRRRVISDGKRSYVAFDAHGLLEEGESGRPGHVYD